MKKTRIILSAIAGIFFFGSCAFALKFSGFTIGTWTQPVAGPTDIAQTWNSQSGSDSVFTWGTPSWSGSTGSGWNNRLVFKPKGSATQRGWNASLDQPFRIADLDYRNGSALFCETVEGVSLEIDMYLTSPGGYALENFSFDFSILNTRNSTGDPVKDEDVVTVAGSNMKNLFFYEDAEYRFDLLGFSSDMGKTIRTDFSSPEGSIATAGLYAVITQNDLHPAPEPVPEPSTILLIITALPGLAVFRKHLRNNRNGLDG